MQNITVSKKDLLETLTTKRGEHRSVFDKAQVAYREQVIQTWIDLPEPKDYTDEFDKAIAMVEWQVGDTIELSERDFQRYVLNQWEWAGAFAATTSTYLGS